MVYCGKPSKACAECRLRRTRCDGKRPSCSQCIRAERTCRGYRDPADLMFRNESQSVSAKHQRVKETQNHFPKDNLSKLGLSPMTPIEATSLVPMFPVQPITFNPFALNLGTSAEDQATCFFFQNYVSVNEPFQRDHFYYLSDLYGSEEVGSAVADSVASLGMVGLAHFWGAPNIMHNARVKYNLAMQTVSSKLRDINEAKSDQTLIAIILLGLYETNTCEGPEQLHTWAQHVNGALALLKLRGKEQLRTPIGYRLFIHVRGQIITNCIQKHLPIPPIISEWSEGLDFEHPEQAATTFLCQLSIRYCNLRASMSSFRDYSDSERIVVTACEIDAEYAIWAKTCPTEFIYQTITLSERSDEVFSDHYHMYSSQWVAAVWNNYRCIRILLNELILDQLSNLFLHNPESSLLTTDARFFENQVLESNNTLLQLCQDICASVPYFLGFDPSHKNKSVPKAVKGNLLIWPLYVAACTPMVSDLMRTWVAGRLKFISDTVGIRQGAPLALAVSRKQDLQIWQPEDDATVDCHGKDHDGQDIFAT